MPIADGRTDVWDRIYRTCVDSVGGPIKTDGNLNWKFHVYDLVSKFNRANAVLCKLRHFVTSEILRFLYFTIFQSYVNEVCIALRL